MRLGMNPSVSVCIPAGYTGGSWWTVLSKTTGLFTPRFERVSAVLVGRGDIRRPHPRVAAATLESIRTTSIRRHGGMMIKLIVRGRTWWMVRGCLYGSVADAIAARDA